MENKLIKEIKNLRTEIKPRSEWVSTSRALLLQQITKDAAPVKVGFGSYFQLFGQIFRQSLLEPAVIMLLMMATFLGSSLTINAAFYSLPGEPLYHVKLALENTHAAMTTNEADQVALKIEFAQKRMEELNKIVSSSDLAPKEKTEKIKAAVAELKNNVSSVNSHLTKISQSIKQTSSDKIKNEQTVQMALTISSKTEELFKSLDKKIQELPATENSEVKDLVAGAAQSVQDVNLSAQQLVDGANQTPEVKEGTVKGADSENSAQTGTVEIQAGKATTSDDLIIIK
ncbi:MAG: DUF5667 domain-containing protein [Candidatus Buchananbacteria bacterium]